MISFTINKDSPKVLNGNGEIVDVLYKKLNYIDFSTRSLRITQANPVVLNLTFGVELEFVLTRNGKTINPLDLAVFKDKSLKELFESPVGVDGDPLIVEIRTKPYRSLKDAIEEAIERFALFISTLDNSFTPSFGKKACGLHVNVGGASYVEHIGFLLDVCVYSFLRRLNPPVRITSPFYMSKIKEKSEIFWEYRALPASSILANTWIEVFEWLVKSFYEGKSITVTIDEYGFGWIEELKDLQKKMEEEVQNILFGSDILEICSRKVDISLSEVCL